MTTTPLFPKESETPTINKSSRNIWLSPDERYDIFEVKSVERPHLVHYNYDDDDDDDDASRTSKEAEDHNGDDDHETATYPLPLPLLDGADIAGWRQSQLIPISYDTRCVLGVGLGCPLLRRETQLPIGLPSPSSSCWSTWKQRLLIEPPACRSVQRLSGTEERQHTHPAWFERQNIPVLMEAEWTSQWKAMTTCRWDALLKRYGGDSDDDCCVPSWRVSDTHGACLTLQTYHKYMTSIDGGMVDDAPLAIYDSQFHCDHRKELLDEYTIFPCFQPQPHDLLACLEGAATVSPTPSCTSTTSSSSSSRTTTSPSNNNNNIQSSDAIATDEDTNGDRNVFEETTVPVAEMGGDSNDDGHDEVDSHQTCSCSDASTSTTATSQLQRPPYRWILMGPERSGTGLHIDPLGTHAWVTVIEGLKRWVLFPYGTDLDAIGMKDPQIPSSLWFCCDSSGAPVFTSSQEATKKTTTTCSTTRASWYERAIQAYPNEAVEVLQRPGETVYVPAGWPHLVLNLERTIAITENYASAYPSLQRISTAIAKEEPEIFPIWKQLQR